MSIELTVNIPVGGMVGIEDDTAVGGLGQPIAYKWKFK
jgi:hypothetical protein